jgi:hypothetical protein
LVAKNRWQSRSQSSFSTSPAAGNPADACIG